MNNAKMTFRFNHGHNRGGSNGRLVEEQPQVAQLQQEEYQVIDANSNDAPIKSAAFIDAQSLNQYTSDYGGWQSSFDTETLRVERLIRESAGQSFHSDASHLKTLQVPDQKGPLQNEQSETLRDHQWYVPEETSYVRKKKDASWIKVAISVVGAVGTGVAFGFFVLSMFSGDTQGTKETAANRAPVSQITPNTQQNSAATDKAGASGIGASAAAIKGSGDKTAAADPAASIAVSASVSGSAVTAVNIPAKTLTFLQSGIFSTPQGANTAQTELTRKGLAAVSDTGDKFPVYVGMTLKREEAVLLAQQFQQKKIEVILKNMELPALSKIKWNSKPSDALPSYIAQGDKLLQMISPLVLKHLSEVKLTALDNAELQSVKTAHQAWAGQSAGVNEGLSEESKGAVQKMNSAMNSAMISLDEYKKNSSASLLWQTQNAMMQYVLAQKELRKTIAAP